MAGSDLDWGKGDRGRAHRAGSGLLLALALTPLVVAGVAAAFGSEGMRSFLGSLFKPYRGGSDAARARRFALRDAILGNSKEAVAQVFGPPRTASFPTPQPVQGPGPPSLWQADIWYYALEPRQHLAMAVLFDQGLASEVQFIGPVGQGG